MPAISVFPESLPIIDLAPSYEGEGGLRTVAAQINETCRRHGFFYIVNHGVPSQLILDMFSRSARFFEQPIEFKTQLTRNLSQIGRGYSALGAQALHTGKPADLHEGFSVGLEVDPTDGRGFDVPRRGPNLWPSEDMVPGFRAVAEEYMVALDRVSRHLMSLIAVGLKLPTDFFAQYLLRPAPTLRFLCYPPHPRDALQDQAGAGAHTDWGALTLLAQDGAGGLQVLDPSGGWINVEPIQDSFVVNLGDLMARWTNDQYRSTLHRVINNITTRTRYSIPYFFEVDFDTLVSALPGCFSDEEPPRHPVVTAGEHHAEKNRAARLDV